MKDGQYRAVKTIIAVTPQGGVISPLLANIYFHLLDRIVNDARSLFSRHGVRIVRYADDFVLMGNKLPEEVTDRLKEPAASMGLSLTKAKPAKLMHGRKALTFLDLRYVTTKI